MKKTGIMGGTFNPIHMGHLLLAETARIQYELDEVLFIPSGKSYQKQNLEIPAGKVRADMTLLAVDENPYFFVSYMEIERPGNTYTYETLKALKQQEPDTEFYFILGADSLFSMETWKHPEEIFASCTILVAARNEKDQREIEAKIFNLQEKYHACIHFLSCEKTDISSTQIRKLIREGKSVRHLVPDKVIQYIEKKKLYQTSNSDRSSHEKTNGAT